MRIENISREKSQRGMNQCFHPDATAFFFILKSEITKSTSEPASLFLVTQFLCSLLCCDIEISKVGRRKRIGYGPVISPLENSLAENKETSENIQSAPISTKLPA